MSEYERVSMVSGSWPPEICGVGDFMDQLATAVSDRGTPTRRVRLTRWSLLTAVSLLLRSHLRPRELVYMSYPTEGYGKSLLPFALALGSRKRVVLHMHEYSSKNRYARALLRAFKSLERIYFSNSKDRDRYIEDCNLSASPDIRQRWQVLPTPSNIPVCQPIASNAGPELGIVHFGQIRPQKGLEVLADSFARLRDVPGINLVLAGGIPRGYESYGDELAKRFRAAGTRVLINLTSEEISGVLHNARIGVFAFPDGADERRGSLAAALSHGLLCVTTHSARTPENIARATIGIDVESNPAIDADRIAHAVLEATEVIYSGQQAARIEAGFAVARAASFEGIARQMLESGRPAP